MTRLAARAARQVTGSRPLSSTRLFSDYCKLQQRPAATSPHEDRSSDSTSALRQNPPSRKIKGQQQFPYKPFSRPSIAQKSGRGSSELPDQSNGVAINFDGEIHNLSPLLLRDLCRCPRCVDSSTKQKLFATVDIPADLQATVETSNDPAYISLRWTKDIPGLEADHVTQLSAETLRSLVTPGSAIRTRKPVKRALWTSEEFQRDVPDMDYEAYMTSDSRLHRALQHLHTHGLMFLTGVPESESSVSTIASRIGPLKNTFYGYTWDVRSVPQAKNVAYTSQNLGFHMDLLYMQQPPHLQFLHCIRSSSAGGASLFTDSYKAASDLFANDYTAFRSLTGLPVNFHYDHPESQYYFQARKAIELRHPLYFGGMKRSNLDRLTRVAGREDIASMTSHQLDIADYIDAVSWSPPFQAPFSLQQASEDPSGVRLSQRLPTETLNSNVERWYAAAQKFSHLIHRPQGILERMMKPGECVIFDNRRVLHARKAFEVGDVGKERWLRGAYLDKDPYLSKMRVLQGQFEGGVKESASERMVEDAKA